ncbi:MAG: helix-hairpin-helix domain-containing protein [Gemmatimonadales bacterium]|nr:helix-hairpin-helix domain-containing protein [Gemmatimonadales bacterium]
MPSSRKADPLETIPSIGPSLAADLRLLGFRQVGDLATADPERMYQELCRKTRSHQDRCVLYSFRCAVYYASRARHQPELLKWWNWKDRPLAPAARKPSRRRARG